MTINLQLAQPLKLFGFLAGQLDPSREPGIALQIRKLGQTEVEDLDVIVSLIRCSPASGPDERCPPDEL